MKEVKGLRSESASYSASTGIFSPVIPLSSSDTASCPSHCNHVFLAKMEKERMATEMPQKLMYIISCTG